VTFRGEFDEPRNPYNHFLRFTNILRTPSPSSQDLFRETSLIDHLDKAGQITNCSQEYAIIRILKQIHPGGSYEIFSQLLLFEDSSPLLSKRVGSHDFLAHTQLQQLPKLLGYHAYHFYQAPKFPAREKY
jgi:hypothetical protein